MLIYSWNMYHWNPERERALEFIRNLKFDVLCLQEVPEEFLTQLKKLPFYLAAGIEVDWIEVTSEIVRSYCVILSPHNIRASYDFAFPKLRWPRRTSAFLRVMRRWGWKRINNRRSLYADIELPESGLTRVFCLHLTLSYPKRLMREFDTAVQLRTNGMPTIFCGDLNIIESLRVTAINWFLGGNVRDALRWRRSRTEAEKRFAELGLQNPLRGKETQTTSRSQLDHILLPSNFKVEKAEVLTDRVGSDHNPIFIECTPHALQKS